MRPLEALQHHDFPSHYNEHRFRRRVAKALESVHKILATTRHPTYAEATPHRYDDKFGLAELLTAISLAAQLNVLESIGLDQPGLRKLVSAAGSGHAVTLRLSGTERTTYLREATRDVSDGHITKYGGLFESQSVTRITEHFWQHEVSYTLDAYVGSGSGQGSTLSAVPLQQRTARTELMTRSPDTPRPRNRRLPPLEAPITWLLQQVDDRTSESALTIGFRIDRASAKCRTPRRNEQIERALASASSLHLWATSLHNFFADVFQRVKPTSPKGGDRGHGHGLDLGTIAERAAGLFVPVLPLFEDRGHPNASTAAAGAGSGGGGGGSGGGGGGGGAVSLQPSTCAPPLLPRLGDVHAFLAEQRRTLTEAASGLDATFPSASAEKALISAAEAKLCVAARHLRDILAQYSDAVDYVEEMLRRQLRAAIGRELSAADFAQFMVQHEASLYEPSVAPRPFTFAVRRPGHSPEGVVSIEGGAAALADGDPIRTISRNLSAFAAEPAHPMSFALNAATRVTFGGERHVHAFLAHQFDEADEPPPLRLTARARQFSSFLVLLGRLGPGHSFEPSHALIVKDKDELSIPLLLEQLPTPKVFRDAIASLSPEQRRFAQALRSMQLEGSVFGVLLLQLKPQLERLLNLPAESLTKEISLTQSLQELFIEYQIPSDLLSYAGDAGSSTSDKLDAVKKHVKAIHDMIAAAKAQEVASAKQRADYAAPRPTVRMAAAAEEEMIADSVEAPRAQHRSRMAMRTRAAPMAKRMARTAEAAGVEATVRATADEPEMAAALMVEAKAEALGTSAATATAAAAAAAIAIASVTPTGGGQADVPRVVGAHATDDALAPDASTAPGPSTSASQPPAASTPPPTPSATAAAVDFTALDFTALPRILEAAYSRLDADAAIRPTRVAVGEVWRRRAQKAMLAPPVESELHPAEQGREKQKAFDLLDALSRSGALSFDCASLHVLVAATHVFDESLMDTVISTNANPIEKLERSSLIIATTVHGAAATTLLSSEHRERVSQFSAPALVTGSKAA